MNKFYVLTTEEACMMVHEVTAPVDVRALVLTGEGRGIRDTQQLVKASTPFETARAEENNGTNVTGTKPHFRQSA